MGQKVRHLGLAVLAAAVGLLLAGEAGWIAPAVSNNWFLPLAKAGAICFGVGLLLGLSKPLGRYLSRGHCVRCGAPTERGQSYCLDHLKVAVNEAQDHVRARQYETRRRRGGC